jgi:DNA-binding LacI/PurR family transcriptional regulator
MARIKRVTMKDVAEKVGVSQSTVSHVINETAPISLDVRNNVKKAIKELNYVPNGLARNLKKNRTNIIGLLVPDIENAYYSEIFTRIEKLLNEKGLIVFLCSTDYRADMEKKYVEALINQNVDGVIVAYGLMEQNLYNTISNLGIPLVIIDSNAKVNGVPLPSVQVDNIKGSITAVKHLRAIGAKKICFASEPLFNNTARERYKGFSEGVSSCNYSSDDVVYMIEKNFGDKLKLGYNIGTQIILDGTIDAVYATSDYLAFGIMNRLREHNPALLNKIAIMGFDNINLCKLVSPKLTTIAQPIHILCERSVAMLSKIMNDEEILQPLQIFEPSIIIRESTFNIAGG